MIDNLQSVKFLEMDEHIPKFLSFSYNDYINLIPLESFCLCA